MLRKKLEFIQKIIARLLVFLIPAQLARHFWPSFSFVFGMRVDYLSPAVYLTDVLITVLILLWYLNDRKSFFAILRKNGRLIAGFVILAAVNTFYSTSVLISLFKWLKISELVLFGLYVSSRSFFEKEKVLFKALFYSSLSFSVIGIAQFFLGRTTGLFYFLGERSFGITTPGIALVQIFGRDFLRAYSTFPHPNALAGYLGVVLLLVITSGFWNGNIYRKMGSFTLAVCMLLTFSLTGIIAFVFSLLLIFLKKYTKAYLFGFKAFVATAVLLSLFLPLFSSQKQLVRLLPRNLMERAALSVMSGKMVSQEFFIGKGLNTFIINIPEVSVGSFSPWLLQPVHNVYLLVFAETGILGLLVFLWLVLNVVKRLLKSRNAVYLVVFIFILFTGTMDHYWLTIQQNLLLISLLLGFI